jgi:WD40 repeat protein
MPRSVIASVALFVLFAGNASGQQPASWLYLSAVRSGKLLLWDVNADKLVREIPVEDSSGSIGVAVSSDGKRLFVVDGNEVGHLKIYDTVTSRLAAEHTFQNRELSNGGSVVHLSPDDRYLFVNTYDYGEAASGVRVFDVNADAFLKLGLRARQCAAPVLAGARNGVVFSICPRVIYQLKPLGSNPPDFALDQHVSSPLDQPAAVVVSPDSRQLSMVGYREQGQPWYLVQWDQGANRVKASDLRRLLSPSDEPQSVRPWLDMSRDGKLLALVNGSTLWILDRLSLKISQRVTLPGPIAGAAFSCDGSEVLTLRANVEDAPVKEAELVRVSVATGKTKTVPIAGVKLRASPTIFESAVAPISNPN